MRLSSLLALPLLVPPLLAAAPAPRFDPVAFFTGRTEGIGDMRIIMHATRHVRVEGIGTAQPDGSIVLEQKVAGAGRKPTTRTWRLRATAPGQYAGTLSDARGPIAADSSGDVLHLRYVSKGGFRVEQSMTLAPDGRSARNLLVARRWGVVVARLDETIRKLD